MRKRTLGMIFIVALAFLLTACVPSAPAPSYEVKDTFLKGGVYQANSYIVLYYDGDQVKQCEEKTYLMEVIIREDPPSIVLSPSGSCKTLYIPRDFEIKPSLNKN